jgi:hypothetical protein
VIRITLCSLALLGFGTAARAGELDKELAPKAPPVTPTAAVTVASAGSELDKESPEAAYRGRGGWGYGGGRGYYGGFRGYYGGYRGYYGGYRGYYGGYYRPYYAGFGFYPGYYGYGYGYGYNPYLYGGLYAGIGGGYYW